MTLWCAHCRKHDAREQFRVRRRPERLLWDGSRVVSAYHVRCKRITEYPESRVLTQRSTIGAA